MAQSKRIYTTVLLNFETNSANLNEEILKELDVFIENLQKEKLIDITNNKTIQING